MLNTYSPYDDLAAQPLAEWRREVIGRGRMGECDPFGGKHGAGLIRTDPRQPRRQERSVLAHELRHLYYQDVDTDCTQTKLFQEFRADDEAARLLVDVRDLGDAMMLHDRHPSAVAVELRVSDDLLRHRLKHLEPAEWEYLRDRLARIAA